MQVLDTETGILLAQILDRRTDGPELANLLREQLDNYFAGRDVTPIFPLSQNDSLLKIAAELKAVANSSEHPLPPHTALLIRTSGSTSGQGKIVMLSFPNLISSALATNNFFADQNDPWTHPDSSSQGNWINLLPLHHIAGFQTIFRAVFAGKTPIFYNEMEDFFQACEANTDYTKTFFCSLVPAQLAQLLAEVPRRPLTSRLQQSLKQIKFLIGGAAISSSLLNKAQEFGLDLTLTYGMSETSGGCVYNGIPIGDTHISLSPQGQISLSGSSVALGYYGITDDEAFTHTLPAPDADPSTTISTHHTRDIGKITNGVLSITGRIDDAINSGGATIIPQHLENALESHFGLEWHVVGTNDEKWGEIVTAVVKHTSGSAAPRPIPNLEEIKSVLRESFETAWLPRRLVDLSDFADDWPKTAIGKFNRRMLRTMIEANRNK